MLTSALKYGYTFCIDLKYRYLSTDMHSIYIWNYRFSLKVLAGNSFNQAFNI